MSIVRFTSIAIFVALLACTTLFAQDALPVARPPTFHVHGTIQAYDGIVVSGAKITFNGEKNSKTVFADPAGVYEAELPVGLYTMNVTVLKRSLREYRRPLFRVLHPIDLTLNASMTVGISCDLVAPKGSDHIPTEDEAQDACGGRDFFPVSSDDGVPFQLLIDYPNRKRTSLEKFYNSRDLQGYKTQVLVAYNQFTLHADHVTYNEKTRTLEASGDVVVEIPDVTAQTADSMTFRIENGHAIPLQDRRDDSTWQNQPFTYVEYHNERYNFSFEYPKEWKTNEPFDGGGISIGPNLGSHAPRIGAGASVVQADDDGNTHSLDEDFESILASMRKERPHANRHIENVELRKKELKEFRGFPAIFSTIAYDVNGESWINEEVAFHTEEDHYSFYIGFSCHPDELVTFETVYEHVLQTFRILGPAE